MSAEHFSGSFTQQEPIPEAGIEAAIAILRHGRLHRYNTAPDEAGEVAELEAEFAALTGARYALAMASGGAAMTNALRALGVKPGEKVLTNAFTLAPVPGAIAAVGAVPDYVEVTEQLVIDLDHLETKLADPDPACILLLSHMRGHLCDMERLMQICDAARVRVVEDCAHTMGASWKGVASGTQGVFGCYSTQTYKHINSGEGGFLISNDAELMARAIIGSGSYMLYDRHIAAPEEEVFQKVRLEVPNVSSRMDHLRAAILRPQLPLLAQQIERWNMRYSLLEEGLRGAAGLTIIERPDEEHFVGSSIQFLLLDWSAEAIGKVLAGCAARGVELKWFGDPVPKAFTSRYNSWQYAPVPDLPKTDRVLDAVMDMRLPLTFSGDDCALIARIIRDEVEKACPFEV